MKIKQILEGLTDEQVDQFHTELDDLVHKHLGHSSDEEHMDESTKTLTYKDLLDAFGEVYDYVDIMGDSALEKLYSHAPNFDAAMDEYEDIEAIAKNSSQEELQTYIDELEATRYELELETYESVEESSEALTEEQFDEAAGEKDACYHKVKSRYKVWPSAYASGALVKCRKVGAKNWGNKSKK